MVVVKVSKRTKKEKKDENSTIVFIAHMHRNGKERKTERVKKCARFLHFSFSFVIHFAFHSKQQTLYIVEVDVLHSQFFNLFFNFFFFNFCFSPAARLGALFIGGCLFQLRTTPFFSSLSHDRDEAEIAHNPLASNNMLKIRCLS